MKKQQGFTLIELMVVMAIIAILATAGLSAYTGYIKKARDAVRMADINAINKIVIGSMSVNGMPPQSSDGLYDILTDMNNGVAIADPLSSGFSTKHVCYGSTSTTKNAECYYTYRICDSGLGYAVGTRFESVSNIGLYLEDAFPLITVGAFTWNTDSTYEIGSCKVSCATNNSIIGCPTNERIDAFPTRLDGSGATWLTSSL